MSKGDYVPLLANSDFDVDEQSEHAFTDRNNITEDSRTLPASNLRLYKMYFDVDTHQVLKRLLGSIFPFKKDRSLMNSLKPYPDMYGPFWVTATLIFSIALVGSVRDYYTSTNFSSSSMVNFTRVTILSAILFVYWLVMPFALASAVWFRRPKRNTDLPNTDGEIKLSNLFVKLLAVYGYSLTIFIPCSFLLLIPYYILQWIVLAIALVLSSAVLATSAKSIFEGQSKKVTAVLLLSILIVQVLLVAGLSFVFFYHPELVSNNQANTTHVLETKLTTLPSEIKNSSNLLLVASA